MLNLATPTGTEYVDREGFHRPALRGLVAVLACATVFLAPLGGYLRAAHPEAAKVPAVLLVGAWLALQVVERRWPRPHPVQVLLALLMAVMLISTATHLTSEFALQYAIRWVPFLVVAGVLVDVCAFRVRVDAIIASAVAGALVAGLGALQSIVIAGDRRASGPLEDPNDLAYVLAAAVPLLVALLLPPDRPGARRRNALIGAAAAVLVLGTAATFSRGGILALTAAVAWLVLRGALSPRVLAASAVTLAAGAAAFGLAAWGTLRRGLEEKQFVAGDNIDSRLLRWEAAARVLAREPLLGAGPGGVRSEYVHASGLAEIAETTPVTHNMYLEVGADLGLVGLALFLGVIVLAFVSAERARRSGFDGATVTAVQASLIAVVVASYFLSEEYYMSLWFVVALCGALELRARTERSTT